MASFLMIEWGNEERLRADKVCQPNRGRGVPAFCRDKGRMWRGVGAWCLSLWQCDSLGFREGQEPDRPTPDKHKAPASSPLIPLSLHNEDAPTFIPPFGWQTSSEPGRLFHTITIFGRQHSSGDKKR